MVKITRNDKKFGSNGDFETTFVLEILIEGVEWYAAPGIFYSKEEAEKQAEFLKTKYPFISKCRVVARKEKD